jgi:hypothetical protein
MVIQMKKKFIRQPTRFITVSNSSDSQSDKSSIFDKSGLLGPTIIVAILTSMFILLTYLYSNAFFDTLSLPSRGIELPKTFFLNEVFYSLLLGLVLLYFIMPVIIQPENSGIGSFFLSIVLAMAALFLIAALLFGIPNSLHDQLKTYIKFMENDEWALIIILLLIITRIHYWINYSKKERTFHDLVKEIDNPKLKKPLIILIILVLLFYTYVGATTLGRYHADRFIEQSMSKNFLITIELKENGTIFRNETTLTRPLVMHYDSKYYLLDKDQYNNTQIDIIPDDQVRAAKIIAISPS